MVPGLLGGWFHSSAIQSGNCQLQSNWHKIGHALARIGKSHADPGHSEDNCVYNQGTSALYRSVPSLLGGRNRVKAQARRQYRANLDLPLTYQSGVNPCKSANPIPICPWRSILVNLINHQGRRATAEVSQSGNSNTNCSRIDTALAAHWHALAKVMPILDIWRTIVSLIYWTRF